VSQILKYYDSLDFVGSLIIIDSSDLKVHKVLKKEFEKYRKNFSLIWAPNKTTHQAVEIGVASLPKKTQFVIQTGDDDYVCTSNINNLLNFLNSNPSYSSVYGNAYSAGIKVSPVGRFKVTWIRKYWAGFDIDDDSHEMRAINLLDKYINLEFAVRRKKNVHESLKTINNLVGRINFKGSSYLETFMSVDTALYGKVGYLNQDFLIRGDHKDRPNRENKTFLRKYLESNLTNEFRVFLTMRLVKFMKYSKKEASKKANDIAYNFIELTISRRVVYEKGKSFQVNIKRFRNKVFNWVFKYRIRKYVKLIQLFH
jgi:glycosyltransferase domain-containing protein